jgi:hypothetical protein
MADTSATPRSRRALLAAAAGGAAALAAQAALPLSAAAASGDPVLAGTANTADASTSLTMTTADQLAFKATANGFAAGLAGSSSGSAGVAGFSISEEGAASAVETSYTGVYGWSPAPPDDTSVGVGVWGDSDDWGVYGQGTVGVYGYGHVGVIGEADSSTSPGVIAYGMTTSTPALQVVGKVKFNRSGRKSIAAGKSSVVVTLAGTTSTSKIFAVLASNRSGRYVRAVVPAAGKFTIYLNTTVSSSSTISWFVLD